MNTDFSVEVEHAGHVTIRVSGEVDIATVARFEAALASSNSMVVVDLSGVTFIDATGLGALVAARRRARDTAITSS